MPELNVRSDAVDVERVMEQIRSRINEKRGVEYTEQQIQERANAELKKSLAKQKLTVDQYNRIYNRINSDERLREKALKLVEEERKKSSEDKS